jgi:predicted branched-subunit amino acid permease
VRRTDGRPADEADDPIGGPTAAKPGSLFNRRGVTDGLRALLPMVPPAPIFGMVFGLLLAETEVVGRLAGWSSSWIVFGGASQLAAVLVIEAGGSALFAVITILVVNARHLMYSAALQPRFADAPRWFRVVGPYVLTDQLFATTEERPDDDPMDYKISHYLAGGLFWLVLWNVSVAAGLVLGDLLPTSWSLEFAVPLLFLGLLINALRDRPGLVAAAVSGTIAVVGQDLEPAGLGLLGGAICGMTVAALLDHRLERRRGRPPRSTQPAGRPDLEGEGAA